MKFKSIVQTIISSDYKVLKNKNKNNLIHCISSKFLTKKSQSIYLSTFIVKKKYKLFIRPFPWKIIIYNITSCKNNPIIKIIPTSIDKVLKSQLNKIFIEMYLSDK